LKTCDFDEREHDVNVGGVTIPATITQRVSSNLGHMILFLYGGSCNFSRQKLRSFSELFLAAGFSTCTFDYRGMNSSSEIPFSETGLATRIEDARAVETYIRCVVRPKSLIVYGISTAGHIASYMTGADAMILQAPAAYSEAVVRDRIPFGPRFTEILHTVGSWRSSEAFSNMFTYREPVLVLQIEQDAIVPELITQQYLRSTGSSCKQLEVISGFTHRGTFDDTEEAIRKRSVLAERSISWLVRRFVHGHPA
jgi:alpha-beta hydrolase superfamily lysophospholipase